MPGRHFGFNGIEQQYHKQFLYMRSAARTST